MIRLLVGLILGSLLIVPSLQVEKTILEGKGTVLLPNDFALMDEQMLNAKYPSTSKRPKEVYTDFSGEINIAFNHTWDKASLEDLQRIKSALVNQFDQVTTVTLLNHQMHTINGREYFFVEFLSPALDTEVYNLMFGTAFEGRLLMGTFNCTIAHRPVWESKGKEIVNTIKLH